MSDSDLSSAPPTPSDTTLEKALRDAVASVCREGNKDDLTVKRMRLAAEKELGLAEGFFKGEAKWKAESERIIRDEVVLNHYGTRWRTLQADVLYRRNKTTCPPPKSSPP